MTTEKKPCLMAEVHEFSLPQIVYSTNAQGPALQCAVGGLQSKLLVIPELSLERLLASSFAADVIGDHQNLGAGRDESYDS